MAISTSKKLALGCDPSLFLVTAELTLRGLDHMLGGDTLIHTGFFFSPSISGSSPVGQFPITDFKLAFPAAA